MISRLRSCRDARYLQVALGEKIRRPAVLDASGADVAHEVITEGLARSDALGLLRPELVLTRPGASLELFLAVRHRIPTIPMRPEGPGHDWFETQVFLAGLGSQLEELDPGSGNMVKFNLAYETSQFRLSRRS